MESNVMYTLETTPFTCEGEFIQYHYTNKNMGLFVVNKKIVEMIPEEIFIQTVQDYDTYPEDPDYDEAEYLKKLSSLPLTPLTRSYAIITPNLHPDESLVWLRLQNVNIYYKTQY